MSLADAITEALRMRQEMRSQGMTAEELDRAFQRVVRDVWPTPADRSEPWHYYCEACLDTGLELGTCDGRQGWCGRRKTHGAHEYGKACTCAKGAAFRKPERTMQDAIAVAARTAKPSRFGGRV